MVRVCGVADLNSLIVRQGAINNQNHQVVKLTDRGEDVPDDVRIPPLAIGNTVLHQSFWEISNEEHNIPYQKARVARSAHDTNLPSYRCIKSNKYRDEIPNHSEGNKYNLLQILP